MENITKKNQQATISVSSSKERRKLGAKQKSKSKPSISIQNTTQDDESKSHKEKQQIKNSTLESLRTALQKQTPDVQVQIKYWISLLCNLCRLFCYVIIIIIMLITF